MKAFKIPESVLVVIHTPQLDVLLLERADHPGFWQSVTGSKDTVEEPLLQTALREVMEETGIAIEPVALAGYREHIERDVDGRVRRHFVILPFACRWISGEGVPLLEELSELRWLRPSGLAELATTPGLAAIVAAAFERMEAA